MAKKRVEGVAGVLANLVGPTEDCPKERHKPAAGEHRPSKDLAKTRCATTATPPRPRQARRGRPPGRTPHNSVPKEKVTLRIRESLMAEYREWSWEMRCQLGELVERALAEYRNNRRTDG